MDERISTGTWVEIHAIVLAPHERAEHLPAETRCVVLEMRAKGFLTAEASLGEEAEIATVTGRRLRGTLKQVNPAYLHGFGAPIAELQTIGTEVKELLRVAGPSQ